MLLLVLAITLSAVILGTWFYLRRNAALSCLSFACPGCGKTIKARGTLAGRKVKCPGCGQATLVPA